MTITHHVGDVLDVVATLPDASVDLVARSPLLSIIGDMPKSLSIPGRWFEKVNVRGVADCWLWMAAVDKDGYGKFQVPKPEGGQQCVRAHRYGYELLVGPIPEGHHVCHQCDNPTCCNPSHLFTGTNQDNVDDRMVKGRGSTGPSGGALINSRKTHCKAGHPLSGPNLSIVRRSNGRLYRRCKACAAATSRRLYREAHGLPGPGSARKEVLGDDDNQSRG